MRRILLTVGSTMLALASASAFSAEVGVEVRFSTKEAEIIAAYYGAHAPPVHSARPGRGRQGLPPGIAKNLARGKPLPRGIAKVHLPDELERRLPPPPAGYERIIVDGKVLLVEMATRVIHDALLDAVLD